MATYTDKLGLIKPAGTDPFLLTDFNSNTDLIDRAPGVHYCTSSTRPSWGVDEAGRMIVETDTKKMFIWPGSGSFVEVVNTLADTANTNANTAVSTANSASSTASVAYAVATDTANQLDGLAPIFYRTTSDIYVAAGQGSYLTIPDSPAKGIVFTAPASGKVTIQVGGQLYTRTVTTSLSYALRVGGSLGSGAFPTMASTVTPANAESYGGMGLQGLNSATDDLILTGAGLVGYHSGLTPGSTYNVCFTHYNSNAITAIISNRSMIVTPLP